MTGGAMMQWQGLEISRDPEGGVGRVVDAATGEVLLHHLRVVLPQPWRLDGVDVLQSETEQRWSHPCGASAVVRQVFDETWTLRVLLLNRTDEPVQVPAPRLACDSAWPMRRLFAGGEACIQVDPGRAEQLLLTQLQGHALTVGDEVLLTPDPLVLAGAAEAGTPGQFTVSWRAAWLADHRRAAQVLPAWWPPTALRLGEEAWFALPDAAVTSDDGHVEVVQQEGGTWAAAHTEGRHTTKVHNRLGTVEVEIAWARDLADVAAEHATRLLGEVDPRACSPWQSWIVAHELARLGDQGVDWLRTAVEESFARHHPAHPLQVMSACALLAHDDARDLWEGFEALVGRLPAVVGAPTAMVHARMLAMQWGLVSPVLRGARRDPGNDMDAIDHALWRVETALMAPADEPDDTIWRVCGLLGAGLPGETVDPVRLAQVHMVTAMVPEHWQFEQRWPAPLAMVRQDAQRRALARRAEEGGGEALAWLLAGF